MTTDAKWAVITELNERVKLRLAPSKIHGVGVFAMRDIKRGEKLYVDHMPRVYSLRLADMDNLKPEIKALLLERWPQIVNGSNFIYPDARMLAYMNHSDEPNVDSKNDVALSDISSGDELTEDYRLIPNYKEVFDWLDKTEQVQ